MNSDALLYHSHTRYSLRPTHIIGIAITVTLHILIMMTLLLPASEHALQPSKEVVTQIKWSESPVKIELPPPPPLPIVPVRTITPVPQKPAVTSVPVLTTSRPQNSIADSAEVTSQPADDYAEPAQMDDALNTFDIGAPAIASLRTLAAPPPKYPRPALQRRLTGTVVLMILVDAEGKPISVNIEQSSGHAVLDREAIQHVLRRWRFEPARQAGVAMSAYARVPIDFSLPE